MIKQNLAAWKLANKLHTTPLAHTVQLANDLGVSTGQVNEALIVEDLTSSSISPLAQQNEGNGEQTEIKDGDVLQLLLDDVLLMSSHSMPNLMSKMDASSTEPR